MPFEPGLLDAAWRTAGGPKNDRPTGCGQLKALADDYERRAENAAHVFLLRPWLGLLANAYSSTTPVKQGTLMNVIIQKLNGLWHLVVGSCQIRTPYLETQDRALVVAYARRVYLGAKIIERD